MKIKFGDFNYFVLLNLQDKLRFRDWDRLDLINLDRLRTEVDIKVRAIHLEEDERRAKLK